MKLIRIGDTVVNLENLLRATLFRDQGKVNLYFAASKHSEAPHIATFTGDIGERVWTYLSNACEDVIVV